MVSVWLAAKSKRSLNWNQRKPCVVWICSRLLHAGTIGPQAPPQLGAACPPQEPPQSVPQELQPPHATLIGPQAARRDPPIPKLTRFSSRPWNETSRDARYRRPPSYNIPMDVSLPGMLSRQTSYMTFSQPG